MTIILHDIKGNAYNYEAYPVYSNWSNAAGHYAFAYITPQITWQILYIGETECFADRFRNHHALPAAIAKGATHILARCDSRGLVVRQREEKLLIERYAPVLNKQHNPYLIDTPLTLLGNLLKQ